MKPPVRGTDVVPLAEEETPADERSRWRLRINGSRLASRRRRRRRALRCRPLRRRSSPDAAPSPELGAIAPSGDPCAPCVRAQARRAQCTLIAVRRGRAAVALVTGVAIRAGERVAGRRGDGLDGALIAATVAAVAPVVPVLAVTVTALLVGRRRRPALGGRGGERDDRGIGTGQSDRPDHRPRGCGGEAGGAPA